MLSFSRGYIMYCFNCGKEIANGMNFCPFCGTRIDTSAALPKNESAKENKLYDIILLESGNAKLNLIKHVKETHGLDLSEATKLVGSNLPVISENLSFDAAIELATKFEEQGAKLDVAEHGLPYTPPTLTTQTSPPPKSSIKADPRATSATADSRKKKHLAARIIELSSEIVFSIAALLVMFLPTVSFDESKISMVKYVLQTIPKIKSLNIYSVYYLFSIIAFVYVLIIAIRSIIILVRCAKRVVSFETVYATEVLDAKPENVETFLKNKKRSHRGMAFELIGDALVFFFSCGYISTKIPAGLIVVGVIIVIHLILNAVAKHISQSANQT